MVAVELIGGLGNQMFQYAAARSLALFRDEELLLDKRLFAEYTLHGYGLNNFNIHSSAFDRQKATFEAHNFFHKAEALLLKKKVYEIYEEKGLPYDENLFKISCKNIYLKGYFQTEKYFKKFEDQLRKDFEIISSLKKKTTDLLEIIDAENSVSLHIRRGDYVSNPEANAVHGTCDINYYHKAINVIKEKIKGPVFFIFSDDIEWAKDNLTINNEVHFVDFNDAFTNYEDLKLMSSCKHNIIANSSFSWWGAWLNQNQDKIVIAPSRWFQTDIHNSKDILPTSWLKI